MKDKLGREIQVGDEVVAARPNGRHLLRGDVAEVAPFAIRVVFDIPGVDTNKVSRVLVNTSELAIVGRDR